MATAAAVVLLLAVVFVPMAVSATDGDLDPTFGANGVVRTVFPSASTANAVAVQSDGRIVAVGDNAASGVVVESGVVARYLADGRLDPSFGGDGAVEPPIEASSVAIQPNGRIVVAGADRERFAVVRYLANGLLDPGFGNDGIALVNLTSGDDHAWDVAVQPNGKIVVVGRTYARSSRLAVVRFRRNGILDPTFGGDGVAGLPRAESGAFAVVLQPNGRIVVAGEHRHGLLVARFLADGRLDGSFGDQGVFDGGGWRFSLFSAWAVALQDDGRILVGGSFDGFYFGLARFTSRGRLDPSFSGNGVVSTQVGGGEQAIEALVIRPNGRIVAVGEGSPHEWGDGVMSRFVLLGYRPNGRPDTTWGGDGQVVTRFARGAAHVGGAAEQPDGDIVVAGDIRNAFALARYRG